MKTLKSSLKKFLIGVLSLAVYCPSSAQPDSTLLEKIAVRGRSAPDSIILRWAPTTYRAWQLGNTAGYRIERQVIARGGTLLLHQEKAILHSALLAWPVARWERLVMNDQYAAIAAQALYGDRFEVDLSQSDIFTIVNKVRENEQRFSFALFCADMSSNVAAASGLWFVDRTVKTGERYLYRIVANASDSLQGSIYISPDDLYSLHAPQNLKAEFKDRVVFLKWDRVQLSTYTAFLVERSADGIDYLKVTDAPLVTVAPHERINNRFEYAIDSLPDPTKLWHYRVRGITPFGEEGPASEPVSGRGIPSVESVPFITSAAGVDNATILLKWDFPETSSAAIKGFSISRAASPDANYTTLTEGFLRPERRTFEDTSPQKINYYRVQAHGLNGETYTSHTYFAQLIDSIPPSAPSGLIAVANDSGVVTLSWKPNQEKDIYGYRVYKAYFTTEEPAQMTTAPLSESSFVDQVDLNTLNKNVYYQVMALDINQNHSTLSDQLKVNLPDKVKPLAPVLLPLESDSSSIALAWTASGSDDVKSYRVYRKVANKDHWLLIATIPAAADSIYQFADERAIPGTQYYYTVISIDDAGLESDPARPVISVRPTRELPRPIKWKKPTMSRENNRFTIAWEYQQPLVRYFRIYRSTDSLPAILLISVKGSVMEYTDSVIPAHAYSYRVMAVFEDGRQSRLSDELQLNY